MRRYGVMIMIFSEEFFGNYSSKENLMSFIDRIEEIYLFFKRYVFWFLIINVICN